MLTDPKLRPSKYWRCSNNNSVPEVKWEPSLPEVKRHLEPLSQRINGKMASRAASLSGFFAIFCDVSRNMYIFQFSLLWCFRKDCQIKSPSECFARSDKINCWNVKATGGIFYFLVRTGKFIYSVVNHNNLLNQHHLKNKTLKL